MPETVCSFCENQVEVAPVNQSDTIWDWRCQACGQPVLIDGNAKEQQRQRQARNRISKQIQELAEELDTAGYEPYPYSVEQLDNRVREILDKIDQELDRR